jgi:hypothetical protein
MRTSKEDLFALAQVLMSYWFIDIFCKCATGATEPIAVLFKTNVLKNFNLRCHLFFTARAWTEERGDLARRTLFFPVRTMSRQERTDVTVIAARIQDPQYRRTLQLETLVRLQLVLRAMNAMGKKQYVGESGMLDYEFWTRRVAEREGWEEQMRQIWEIRYTNGQTLAASANTMVQTIRLWLGKIGGWMKPDELFLAGHRAAIAKCRRALLPLFGPAFLARTAFAKMPGPTPELRDEQWCHQCTRKHTAPSFPGAEPKVRWPTEAHSFQA